VPSANRQFVNFYKILHSAQRHQNSHRSRHFITIYSFCTLNCAFTNIFLRRKIVYWRKFSALGPQITKRIGSTNRKLLHMRKVSKSNMLLKY
jgi:hypothetical protein